MEKIVSVTALKLDAENPRVPPMAAALDQRQLIAELVVHENVYELAKQIAEQGYWPLESLIGLEDDGKTIILEGNRRLAALKSLLNPELVPDAYAKRFKALVASLSIESIKKVRVLYAPTREAAAPLIMQKHTRTQVESWSPLMQARFIRSLAKEGVSIPDIAKQYGVSASSISASLRLDAAYRVACSLELPADIASKVHDPRDFPASTLERLIETPKTREFLGIDFGPDGKLTGKIDVVDFRRAYTRIISDIVNGSVDTRSLNRAIDVENYLSSLGPDAPSPGKGGSFVEADIASDKPATGGPKPEKSAPKSKSTKTKKVSAALITRGFKCTASNHRIREIADELRALKVDSFPNAVGILLRVLLDLSVGHYMDKTKKITPLLEKAKKDGKSHDWYPTLNQMLNEMNKDPDVPLSPMAKKRLQKMLTDKNSILSVELLDAFAHNRFALPTARDLRGLWDTFEGIFEVTLVEPTPPPKAPKPTPQVKKGK